jgi:FKBP-type peptidyl-prolyl cis-trans isomerase 2
VDEMKNFSILVALVILFSGCSLTSEVIEVGDTVTVNYIGMLEDGRIFDTSIKEVAENQTLPKTETFTTRRVYVPLKFTVGAGSVIRGFEEGVIGMKEGEEKEIVIPPEKGYGITKDELIITFPRIQKASVVEAVRLKEIEKETGISQVEINSTIPWRYWRAKVEEIRGADLVVLRNEVQDMTQDTAVGTLEIVVEHGIITATLSPTLHERVQTKSGQAKVVLVNETEFALDYNHHLAGKTLTFNLTLVTIEKANE